MLYKKKKWIGYLFILPFAIFAGIFILYPMIQNFINMFLQYRTEADRHPKFVGFENFSRLVNIPGFSISIANTMLLVVFVIIFQVGIALLLALLVNSIKRGQQLFRILYFMPIVISGSAIGLMFILFSRDDQHGLFNYLLNVLGIEHGSWIPTGKWWQTFSFVIVPVLWQYIGFYFVILLTGLANISDDILEAAKLDGASGIKCSWYIMIPMLQNVFRTCMVLAITGALKVYDIPQVLARGNSDAYFMGTFSNMLYGRRVNLPNGRSISSIGESAIYGVLMVAMGIAVAQISNLVLRENKDI